MTRTCGSKLLLICVMCGENRSDEDAFPAAAPSGENQITMFDASPGSLGCALFFAGCGLTISTLTDTGAAEVWASKTHAPKHARAGTVACNSCFTRRIKKCTPCSD